MSETTIDVRGFWYYSGIILGVFFISVAIVSATAFLGLLTHALARVFLFGWSIV